MTNWELIEYLKKLPQDSPVYVEVAGSALYALASKPYIRKLNTEKVDCICLGRDLNKIAES